MLYVTHEASSPVGKSPARFAVLNRSHALIRAVFKGVRHSSAINSRIVEITLGGCTLRGCLTMGHYLHAPRLMGGSCF